MLFQIGVLLVSFFVLARASHEALRRVIRLSGEFGVSEFVVSFLLVGAITILPELAIGVNSALLGESSFGLGVVFGSNIADLTVIVGLIALLSGGLRFQKSTLREANLLVLVVALPVILFLDGGSLSRIDGVILVLVFLAYVLASFRSHSTRLGYEKPVRSIPIGSDLGVLVLCVLVMLFSGHLISNAAVELSIGLTLPIFFVGIIVALGTCLPEFSLALQASRKPGHSELGFGDILGNVFADCTATIGVIAIVSPITPTEPHLPLFSGALMVLSMLIVIWFSNSKRDISKNEGAILVLLYAFFLIAQFVVEQA